MTRAGLWPLWDKEQGESGAVSRPVCGSSETGRRLAVGPVSGGWKRQVCGQASEPLKDAEQGDRGIECANL